MTNLSPFVFRTATKDVEYKGQTFSLHLNLIIPRLTYMECEATAYRICIKIMHFHHEQTENVLLGYRLFVPQRLASAPME